jgi:hypothetical protein
MTVRQSLVMQRRPRSAILVWPPIARDSSRGRSASRRARRSQANLQMGARRRAGGSKASARVPDAASTNTTAERAPAKASASGKGPVSGARQPPRGDPQPSRPRRPLRQPRGGPVAARPVPGTPPMIIETSSKFGGLGSVRSGPDRPSGQEVTCAAYSCFCKLERSQGATPVRGLDRIFSRARTRGGGPQDVGN